MSIVCLSGFDSEERTKLNHYLSQIDGVRIQSGLNFNVKVLVCNSVKQDKYKVAKMLGIDVVSPSWVYASYESSVLVDTNLHILKFFRKLNLALFGFSDQEYESLHQFIINNDGLIIKDLQTVDVIIFKKGSQYEFDPKIRESKAIVVDSDWIGQCYRRNYYVPTTYYQYFTPKQDNKHLLQDLRNSKVQEALNQLKLNEYQYLKDLVIYIAIKDEQLLKVLYQLISVGDGIYVTTYLPIVTHIVYFQGNSEEIQSYPCKIIHPMWLMDCFIYRRRVIEEDYGVRIKASHETTQMPSINNSQEEFEKNRDSFLLGKQQQQQQQQQQQITTKPQEEGQTSRFGLRSHSFGSFPNNNFSKEQNIQPNLAFNKFSQNITKNKLFQECFIFVFDHPSLDKSMLTQLSSYGALHERIPFGVKYNRQRKIDRAITIFLFPDCTQCKQTIQYIEQEFKINNKQYFSYRWAKYCMEKNLLELQVQKKKLYHLLPTNQITPLREMKNKLIFVSTKDPNDKLVLQQIAEILTGVPPEFNLQELEYYVTDHQSKKLGLVQEANQKARVMNNIEIQDIRWLLELFQGKN